MLDVAFDEALRRETEGGGGEGASTDRFGRDAAAGLREAVRELFPHRRVPAEEDGEKAVGETVPLKNDRSRVRHEETLNTLYVTTQGAYLSKEGETVVVKVDGDVRLRLPVHTIGGIVCFGNVGCSPFLMGFCAENQVGLSFLTEHGRFLARVQGPVSGNVLLRREQYRRADDLERSAEVAKSILTGKIANCRAVLQRAIRDHGEQDRRAGDAPCGPCA